MATYLYQLGRLVARRRRLVVFAWLVLLVGVIALAVAGGGKTVDNFTVPGTQSQQATDLLAQRIPAFAGGQTQVVFATSGPAKVTESVYRTSIEAAVASLRKVPQVAVVSDPFQTGSIAPGGRAALARVQYSVSSANVKASTLDALNAAVTPSRDAGVQTEFFGSVYPGSTPKISELPEVIGIVIGFLILLVTFGAVTAAGLPILTALIGVVIALLGVTAVAAVVDVASASTSLAVMLGLSCGIDYALFISSRHRTNLLQGMAVEDSIALAVGTSGSAVVFAAATVMLALCGLSVVGIPFLTVMGLCAAGAVLIAALVALTLVPALLGFAGMKVARFITPLPHPERPEKVARRAAAHPEQTAGAAWARFVVRFKVPCLIVGVAVLAVIALPAARLQLGLPGGNSQPSSNTAHKAYNLVADTFGVGFNGPLLVVADLGAQSSPRDVTRIASLLQREPDVAVASALVSANHTAIIQVIPKTGPNASATSTLVNRIRDDEPAIAAQTGVRVLVGGTTAANIDTSAKLSSALPVFLIVVVGLAFILLTLAFRTILVPIKSILGFLLSVFAAFGAEVAVFQWGWAKSLFGITPSETVSFLPIILLAIIFGLSSDYEVFVVSRIKEDFSHAGDAIGAVRRGTGTSVRVVSAAALIMAFVFVAFLAENDVTVKAIGFSLAVGVFLDAFVVRLTLVPAVMALIRGKFWYHPQWFGRYIPDLDIEGEQLKASLVTLEAATSVTTPS
jgi:RND superfamily putative drug exporter